MKAAVEQGQTIEVAGQPTIADGLAVKRAGERTLEIVRKYVDEIVTVSEGELASAILKMLEIEKTVVEGGGAAGLAALALQEESPRWKVSAWPSSSAAATLIRTC
jgi:threonine dehydratase